MGVVQLDAPAKAQRLSVAVGDWVVQWANVGAQEGEKRFLWRLLHRSLFFFYFCMMDFFYMCNI